ncbi:MAG: efflux transporter outer membrane subunit [Betaproteobacteria bacterium]|nr:efflux transporter outer membrane subunit [Betaproteobacteria bacterium]
MQLRNPRELARRGGVLKLDQTKITVLVLPLALLGACAAGPDYVRPAVEAPAAFKEGWKQAEPRDREERGRWWEVFSDPLLNSLQAQVDISNQTLVRAEAQFRQAAALVDSARAGYFPSIGGGLSTTRSRASASTTAQPSAVPVSRGVATNYNLSFNASWEADVWGRIGRTVEASVAGAQASGADLEAARLSAHAQLAQSYFQLRALDAQRQLLDDTIAAFEKSLQLTQNRYAAGVAAKADVVQAQTQLKTTQAQAIDTGISRAQLEHAIALLVGKAPSELSIARAPLAARPPSIPAGLPSELLERRPDIAAAERRAAAANAQIGIAKAAYFPSFTIAAATGYQSASMAQWFTAPSRFWSIGPALALSLLDGGLRRSQSDQAIAAYDASVAAYRQTVLTAFAEVEDNLAALRILEQEAQVQDEAVKSARLSLELTLNQYKAGTVSYLNVTAAQATALANERTAVDILNRRLAASVLLIKALGGGWSNASLRLPQ